MAVVKHAKGLTRRDALKVGVGTTVGYALAANPVLAQAIKTDTEGLKAGDVTIQSGKDKIPAYEARPAAAGKYPVIVVISEIFDVHEYIKDVCRRFAKKGYYAIAPEMFIREGRVGHLKSIPEILKVVLAVPRKQILQDLSAAADHARKQPAAQANKVGVTGWCWGGSTTIQFAAHYKDLKAAVAWYGPPARPYKDDPPKTGFDVAKDITCPFLGLFGEKDQGPPPADALKLEELLKRHNKNVEVIIYPGAGHGFHADYRPSYKPDTARAAWFKCLNWFDTYLRKA
jgi:carboxymethylenebutenolidase